MSSITKHISRLATLALAVILASAPSMSAWALADEYMDKFATLGIQFYDPDACANPGMGTNSASSATTINGNSVEAQMWNFFIQNGYTDIQAAAILGNAQAESSFHPAVINKTYQMYGLFQWDKNRQKKIFEAMDAQGLDPKYKTDYPSSADHDSIPVADRDKMVQIQLNHALSEIPSLSMEAFKDADNIELATEIWLVDFEGAITSDPAMGQPITHYNGGIHHPYGKLYQSRDQRVANAKGFLQKYGGQGASVGSGNGPKAIDGSNVTWIGDKVSKSLQDNGQFTSKLSRADLHIAAGKSIDTDAGGNKSGKSIVSELAANQKLREILVFALGTKKANSATEANIQAILDSATDAKTIIFVTNAGKTTDYSANNAVFKKFADTDSRVKVADWEGAASVDREKYFADETTPNAEGAALLMSTVLTTINGQTKSQDGDIPDQCCDYYSANNEEASSYSGTTYTLDASKIKGILSMVKKINGASVDEIANTTSLIANSFEKYGGAKGFATGTDGLINYVKSSGYFPAAAGQAYNESYAGTDAEIQAVSKVLKDGERTLPSQVTERAAFNDGSYTIDNKGGVAEDGSHITWIGDSISVGSETQIRALFPKLKTFDSAVGRSWSAGVTALESYKSNLTDIIVFALGTNSNNVGAAQIQKVLDIAGKDRRVVFTTNYTNTGVSYTNNNAAFKKAAAEHSNVSVADWHAAVSSKASTYLQNDNIHPNEAGRKLYAETLAGAIKGNLSNDASSRGNYARAITKINAKSGSANTWYFYSWAGANSGDLFGYAEGDSVKANQSQNASADACCVQNPTGTSAEINGHKYAMPLGGLTKANYLNPGADSYISQIPCPDDKKGSCNKSGLYAVDLGVDQAAITGSGAKASDYSDSDGLTDDKFKSTGASVLAFIGGKVKEVKKTSTNVYKTSYQNKCGSVTITGSDGKDYWYGYLDADSIFVSAGEDIQTGSEFAKVGAAQCNKEGEARLRLQEYSAAPTNDIGKEVVTTINELWTNHASSDADGASVTTCIGDSLGVLPAKGLSREQAEQILLDYRQLASSLSPNQTSVKIYGRNFTGVTGCQNGMLSNCVAMSKYFWFRFIDLPEEVYSMSTGNGGQVVDNLVRNTAGKSIEIHEVDGPKPFQTFSWKSGELGHTGVVYAVDDKNFYTIEADCRLVSAGNPAIDNSVQIGALRQYSIANPGHNFEFADTNLHVTKKPRQL